MKVTASESESADSASSGVAIFRKPGPFLAVQVKRCTAKVANNSLTTEQDYLRYLLFTAIPSRLICFYKREALLQQLTTKFGPLL